MELTAQEAWSNILERAGAALPEHSFRTWLAPTKPLALTSDRLVVSVASDFAAEWIEHKFGDLLNQSAREALGPAFRVTFEATAAPADFSQPPPLRGGDLAEVSVPAPQTEPAIAESAPPGEPAIGSLNPRYTLDSFVVGDSNELSMAACQAVAEAPGEAYNPLFIYGGVGLGKTHLMQAIGREVLRRFPNSRVAYIATEQFTNELIAAIQSRRTAEFHVRYRRIDLLLVDDAHFLAGKERTQEEFFHTFNALHDAHKQIVLTSDRPPKEIPGLQERLVSRFEWGLVTDVRPPDLETRVAILQAKAAQDNLSIPHGALALIAEHCRSSVRELEGAIIKLLAYSSLTRRELSRELAAEILGGAAGPLRRLTPELIEETVGEAFAVQLHEMRSKSRTRRVTEPRQVAMYMLKTLLDLPYTQIGARFGGRDHSTVIHSIQKVMDRLQDDPEFSQRLKQLERRLR